MNLRNHLFAYTVTAALVVFTVPVSFAQTQTIGACCNFVSTGFVVCQNNVNSAACEFDQATEGDTAGPEGSTCGNGDGSAYGSVAECLGDLILLPVELTSFESTVVRQDVVLRWTTASETNNSGFSIELETGTNVFDEIAFVEGQGTTDEARQYDFTVTDAGPGLHRFRLKQIDFDGAFEYSAVVEATVTVPERFLIEPAYPNPFNPTTKLGFAVAVEQSVRVTLVNSAGQTIRALFNGTVAANEMQQLSIDGSDLASGNYIVHFEGDGISSSEQILLTK